MTHDGRPNPVDAHVLSASRLVVSPHLLPNGRLLPRRSAAPTPLRGPGHAEQALLGKQAAEALRHFQVGRVVGESPQVVGRNVVLDEPSQLRTETPDRVAHVEVHDYFAVQPPSTMIVCPVIYRPASLASHRTAPMKSSTLPSIGSGVLRRNQVLPFSLS